MRGYEMKLSFDSLPQYLFSSPRQFFEGEHHMERYFDESVLILMRAGELCFEEDGEPIRLNPGEYYIQRPFIHQTGIAVSHSPSYYYIHFYGEFGDMGLPLFGTFSNEKISRYTTELELLGERASKVERAKNFYSILSELYRAEDKSPASQIKELLILNFDKRYTLDEVCATLNFSKNHLIRIFHEQYGKSPYRFLIEYRLEKARRLFMTTELSCEQVAYSVGFEEYSVFFKAFRKYYGIAPRDFSETARRKIKPQTDKKRL